MSVYALALLGLAIPSCLLFVGSIVLVSRKQSLSSWLQLIGSVGLTMVVLTHFAKAFDLISWMCWGLEDGAGHCLDLGSAILGLTLFPIG